MSQEPGRRPYKRANRTKNRPVLVASTGQDAMVSPEQEEAASSTPTTDSAVAVETQPTTSTTTKSVAGSSRRLPGFFSTVGRKSPEETRTEAEIVQARLARANRGKAPAKSTDTVATAEKETKESPKAELKKAANKTTAPSTRPPSLFKTRYIFGMLIYLLAANFIGVFITNGFASAGIDHLLTQFTLFGGVIQIRTSTLAYLAMLVILLVVLAYFDLIPRSFSAMSGQKPPAKRGTSSTKQRTSDNVLVKNNPPSMRQGVKGADDDLYEEYRYNQRRSKKK